jgi:hypothetical protein
MVGKLLDKPKEKTLVNNDSFSNMAVENPKEETLKEIDTAPIEVKKAPKPQVPMEKRVQKIYDIDE